MTDRRRSLQALDRLIRVREVRARQALAAAARIETQRRGEAALLARVEQLVAHTPPPNGLIAAMATSARATADSVLWALADDSRARLVLTDTEATRLAHSLAQARAAVDAAVARRQSYEDEG